MFTTIFVSNSILKRKLRKQTMIVYKYCKFQLERIQHVASTLQKCWSNMLNLCVGNLRNCKIFNVSLFVYYSIIWFLCNSYSYLLQYFNVNESGYKQLGITPNQAKPFKKKLWEKINIDIINWEIFLIDPLTISMTIYLEICLIDPLTTSMAIYLESSILIPPHLGLQ